MQKSDEQKITFSVGCFSHLKARLAQLAERLSYTEKVGGSNPSARTNFVLLITLRAKPFCC